MKHIHTLPIIMSFCLMSHVSCLKSAFAQDFHLSHYDAAPHYFNPALTGMYFDNDASYHVYSDYRSQWKALGVKSFSTYYLAFDMPYEQYGIGGYLIHNRNGAGGMNTLNFMPSAAYKITGGKNSPHYLSVGLQIGILSKSINPDNFNYESQFDPSSSTGFNSDLPNNEKLGADKVSVLKLDASMGVFYKHKESNSNMSPYGGLAIYHLTTPSQPLAGIKKDSITGKKIDRIPMRIVLQGGVDMEVNRKLNLKPMILFMTQGKAHEVNIGGLAFYTLKGTDYKVIGGIQYRLKDALILQSGIKYGEHVFRFSYDIGTSYLSKGSFEVSLLFAGL